MAAFAPAADTLDERGFLARLIHAVVIGVGPVPIRVLIARVRVDRIGEVDTRIEVEPSPVALDHRAAVAGQVVAGAEPRHEVIEERRPRPPRRKLAAVGLKRDTGVICSGSQTRYRSKRAPTFSVRRWMVQLSVTNRLVVASAFCELVPAVVQPHRVGGAVAQEVDHAVGITLIPDDVARLVEILAAGLRLCEPPAKLSLKKLKAPVYWLRRRLFSQSRPPP